MITLNTGYKIWNISTESFTDCSNIENKIKYLLNFAALAPSTFNSQPWKCKIVKNKLNILLDKTRIPQKSDKTGRFAYISIGCFIENFIVAATYFNYNTVIKYNHINKDKLEQVATITLNYKTRKKNDSDLINAIKSRTTNRSINIHKKIPESILNILIDFSNTKQKLIILDNQFQENIVNLSKAGDKNIWSDYSFRKEHVGWIRTNLTRAHDGMPAFGVGANTLSSFMATPVILSPFFLKMQTKKNISLLKKSPFYLVLCSEDTEADWLEIGKLFEKILLFLEQNGITGSPMGQFIEDDTTRNELSKLINKKTKLLPQLFFRIGYPQYTVRHSPRMSPDEFLIY